MTARVTTLLKVNQGVDFSQSWRWSTQDNDTLVVTPVDLTNWLSFCQIRGSGNFLLQDDVPITLGGATGLITIDFSAEMSWAWNWTMGKYDIVLFNPDGRPAERWAEGRVDVSPGTSREEG